MSGCVRHCRMGREVRRIFRSTFHNRTVGDTGGQWKIRTGGAVRAMFVEAVIRAVCCIAGVVGAPAMVMPRQFDGDMPIGAHAQDNRLRAVRRNGQN